MMSKRVQIFFTEPSLTKQSFKNECDINQIMKKFKKVAGAEYLSQFSQVTGGTYGDFSNVTDYRSAIEQVRNAQTLFDGLPALVRKRFDNDAALFLDFVHNPANAQELVNLGLATAKAPTDETAKPAL